MTSQTPISYYLSNQDWRTEAPYEYITVETARQRKREGDFFVRGNIMCQESPVARAVREQHQAQQSGSGEWRVVEQTAKPGVRHKPTRIGPGFPRYALV